MIRNDKAPTTFDVVAYLLTFHTVRLPFYAVQLLGYLVVVIGLVTTARVRKGGAR